MPERLIDGTATEFERELLESVARERPPALMKHQMQQAIGLKGPAVWLSGAQALLSTTGAKVALTAAGLALLGAGGASLLSGPSEKVPGLAGSAATVPASPSGSASAVVGQPPLESQGALASLDPGTRGERSDAQLARPQQLDAADGWRVPLRLDAAERWVTYPSRNLGMTVTGVRPARKPGLREEIRLLDSARNAARAGDHAQAERLLESYQSQFPSGILRREAEAIGTRLGSSPR